MSFAPSRPQGPAGASPGKAKRPLWHWILLAGCSVIAVLMAVGFAGLVGFMILNRGNPQDTLDDFYTSMRTGDCELYMEATSEEFREAARINTCEIFERELAGIDVDYEVTKRVNRQGYAIFAVTETYDHPEQGRLEAKVEFYIARRDGTWYMDGIAEADENSITAG